MEVRVRRARSAEEKSRLANELERRGRSRQSGVELDAANRYDDLIAFEAVRDERMLVRAC